MIGMVGAAESEVYKALFELSQSIAGHGDLESLCNALLRSLHRVVSFDFLGLVLPDPLTDRLRLHTLSEFGPHAVEEVDLAADGSNVCGWVWENQQFAVISPVEGELRWREFVPLLLEKGIHSIAIVPLSNGNHRVGLLGFGSFSAVQPSDDEIAFLQRVASEFAVTVDSYLTRQALQQERDRLEVLFDITNTLVSKLSWHDLLAAISEQLSRVVSHDIAVLTVPDKTSGEYVVLGLTVSGELNMDLSRKSTPPEGLPSAEALRTAKPVVMNEIDFARFPSPLYREAVENGFRMACSIPLITRNGACGVLDLGRRADVPFQEGEVRLLVQVGRQIAIALENSMAYKELTEIKERLSTERLYLEGEVLASQDFGNMVGQSLAFQAVLRSLQIVAPTDATVLILGETGTGKELVARAIHDASGRAARSFVKVNCATIPSGLLESELFGHEKGAFTSAGAQKIGRFELADHGTLFLDEIGEIPLELQSKLLRGIQEQEFERLGGTRTIKVDTRFVAATNRDLKKMVDEGKFRADLYYRLHVFPLTMPPLRERKEDIPLLVRYFVQRYAQRMKRPIESIPASVMEALTRYDWPGNVRELQNVLERSVILSQGPALEVSLPELSDHPAPSPRAPLVAQDYSEERERILRALKEADGIVSGPTGAAARLGMKRTTLQSRMRKLNISRHYN
jgi:formate hydrogenlyase transcriptional activator